MSELFKYCQWSLSANIIFNIYIILAEVSSWESLCYFTFTISAHLCISADDYFSFSSRVEVTEFQLSALIEGLATDQENKDWDYIYYNGAWSCS